MTNNSDDFDDIPKNGKKYKVGYKKPPRHGQFKPGQSGNPGGRPIGAKNKVKELPTSLLSDLIHEEANRPVTIHEGEKKLTIPMVQAVLKSVAVNAAKGKHHSQKQFLTMVGEMETNKENEKCELLATTLEYKLEWSDWIKYAERNNYLIPDPIPHPEHIIIDPRSGEVQFIGPMSQEEKKEWDILVANKMDWEDQLVALKKELKENKDPELTKGIQQDIDQVNQTLAIIRYRIPDDIHIPPSTLEFVKTEPEIYSLKTLYTKI